MIGTHKKRLLILYYSSKRISSLPYSYGYPKAFKATPLFDVTICNFGAIGPKRFFDRCKTSFFGKNKFDAVIFLHTAGYPMYHFWEATLKKIGVPIVWFIGNEYRGMPSKMNFAREMGISLLVSQSLSEQVHKIYSDHLGCSVIGLLNSGYNDTLYPAGPPISNRLIDIGYRMFPGPPWLGHWDREVIAEKITIAAQGDYNIDISLKSEDRLGHQKWKRFLQNSRTQLSVSSCGDIFELTDATRSKVEAYLAQYPGASREKIAALFPPAEERVRIRMLSSRILEAASSMTPQIMYRDVFDGPMQPDIDYIALNKNHDNLSDVLDQIKDYRHLEEIAKSCADKLRDFASFPRLLTSLDNALNEIV